jgi:sirohydrochlorin cobaltochelatase
MSSTLPEPNSRLWPCGPRRGVVVVGHGTADPVGAAETAAVAAAVARLLAGVPLELGFLEIARPSIAEALAALARRGCRDVVAAPLLLFTAGHAERDVPDALRDGAALAGLGVVQAAALGVHPDIVRLSRVRREEALAARAAVAAEESVLLLVGRGSSSPTARSQLESFATATAPPPLRVEVGFVAAARPTLAEAINAAASARRVIVQPHLLFRGHVEDQVAAAVRQARIDHPRTEWLEAARLGADPLVARAIVERAAEAAAAEHRQSAAFVS